MQDMGEGEEIRSNIIIQSIYKNPEITGYCINKCCTFKTTKYIHNEDHMDFPMRKKFKCGCFIYDPFKKKILIVQSRGAFWGPPKGSSHVGETPMECAIREVKEETGLDIFPEELTKFIRLKNRAIYYYIEMPECEVSVQRTMKGNDANAISWCNKDCLIEMINFKYLQINQHMRFLLDKIIFQNYFGQL